jgi:GH25 family lysozyme M1 (1,4-beta-N-acetylmuramidase)
MVGIDVSKYQGNIDFKKAKAAGVEFVILRCYVRNNYYDKTKKKYVWCNAPDTKFEQYYKDAKAAGLKVGLYFFTCDYTEENMRKYTQDMIKKCKLSEKQIDFPIAFDWENFDYYKRAHKSNNWSTSTMNKHIDSDLNKMVAVFEEEVEKAGYSASIYGSKSRLEGTWSPSIKNMNAGKNNLSIWMAHWVSKSSYKGDYYMWQVNSHGRVPGISGDVDLDVAYIDRLPSPKAPVKPDDPKDPETGTDTPDTDTAKPSDNQAPEEAANQPEEGNEVPESGADVPEEGNATPDDSVKAPDEDEVSSDGKKSSDDSKEETIPSDDPVDEPADVTDNKTAEPKDASPAKETEPVKETAPAKVTVPAKEVEPEKDASSSKDAAPAVTSPSKQQPEEVRTEEPK